MDYPHAIRHLVKAIYPEQIIQTIIPRNKHHKLLISKNRKSYYLLKKELPYLTAGEFFEDNEGYREGMNLEDLDNCIKNKIDKICFIYPSRRIYWITPKNLKEWGNIHELESTGETTCVVPMKHLTRFSQKTDSIQAHTSTKKKKRYLTIHQKTPEELDQMSDRELESYYKRLERSKEKGLCFDNNKFYMNDKKHPIEVVNNNV